MFWFRCLPGSSDIIDFVRDCDWLNCNPLMLFKMRWQQTVERRRLDGFAQYTEMIKHLLSVRDHVDGSYIRD
jgi:hypothetical protein